MADKKGTSALLVGLAAGQTVRDAAQSAGISERTAGRRTANPDFRRRLTELRAEMVGRALGKLADAAADAVEMLRKLLKAKADSVKLGAARSILELGNKLRESVESEQRLAALEQSAVSIRASLQEAERCAFADDEGRCPASPSPVTVFYRQDGPDVQPIRNAEQALPGSSPDCGRTADARKIVGRYQ